MQNKKEVITGILLIAFFLLIFGLAGRGDLEVAQAELCWSRTHSQTCAK